MGNSLWPSAVSQSGRMFHVKLQNNNNKIWPSMTLHYTQLSGPALRRLALRLHLRRLRGYPGPNHLLRDWLADQQCCDHIQVIKKKVKAGWEKEINSLTFIWTIRNTASSFLPCTVLPTRWQEKPKKIFSLLLYLHFREGFIKINRSQFSPHPTV